jgi:uncharacterized protein (DUF4415 family)
MMKEKEGIRQYSLETLRAMRDRGETQTHADAPVFALDEDFWTNARVVMPPPGKTSVHLRLDADVLEWFREQGKGHLSRMNAVLRSFMESQKGERKPTR